MTHDSRICLVTGGNRGLGFGICRELAKNGDLVILTARDSKKGESAALKLQKEGGNVIFMPLDVASSESIVTLYTEIERRFQRLDVLINNAGILIDPSPDWQGKEPQIEERTSLFHPEREVFYQTMDVNVYGPYQLCDVFIPMMVKNEYGRVVNVSSGVAQLSSIATDTPAYTISKTALNAVTCIFAAKYLHDPIKVNSICPGWVKTEMGGKHAPRSIEEAVKWIVWAANLPEEGATGGFFRDGQPIPW